jgi:2-polyprenyl-3-methyl-5-hydroxy-6-metoxy-1,4-benzoquinol methylase
MICRICANSENNKAYQIREMMFGFRDQFTYFECSQCGCLQITETPRNMEKYYPSNYYSFQQKASGNFIKRFIRSQGDRYALFNTGFIGRLVFKRYATDIPGAIAKAKVNYKSRILDVGCGSGRLLCSLKDLGVKNLLGLDPYVDESVINGGVKILKKTIHDLSDSQKFDLIVFNHSFEHIPDQSGTLSKVSRILERNGVCLIRMPLKTEHIWNLYGVDWVQIDAPRHLLIHTTKSFNYLAKEAGLAINDVIFDSTEFQFWCSEQYKRDIPLIAENSYAVNPRKSIFTAKQIKEFRKMAAELNKIDQGDQAAFYLVRNVE